MRFIPTQTYIAIVVKTLNQNLIVAKSLIQQIENLRPMIGSRLSINQNQIFIPLRLIAVLKINPAPLFDGR